MLKNSIESAFYLRSSTPSFMRPVVTQLVDKLSLYRPFGTRHRRALMIFDDNRISLSQAYPFAYYSKHIRENFDLDLRFTPFRKFLEAGEANLAGAEVVFLQTWFDVSRQVLEQTFEQIRKLHPGARIFYLDSFAPTDLRLASLLHTHVDGYIKKHLLKDRSRYASTTQGDTNLEEYYGALYGIRHAPVNWNVPAGFADNVIIGPGFFTAPHFLRAFLKPLAPDVERPIDLHARFAIAGTPWYMAMRTHAQTSAKALSGLDVRTGSGAPPAQYMRELRSSKACFSPFGYGEVCWRDIEAMLTGSVLIKPDMSHADVRPAVFIPGETYVPVRWDFSDLADKVNEVVNNADYRRHITQTAHRVIQEYLENNRFLEQMRPCLA